MATDDGWPPKSPHHALLSSPSGRRKYEASRITALSPRRLPGTPSLLDKLRAARADKDHLIVQHSGEGENDDDEDDEETLQLKLAAIEAKLKLKKLQQSKIKNDENARPKSSECSITQTEEPAPRIQVPLSPSKRLIAPATQRSPGRVLLGIDKGINAADVSLRRSKTVGGSPSKERRFTNSNVHNTTSRVSNRGSAPHGSTSSLSQIQSFSERMASMRQVDKQNEQKSDAIRKSRSTNFKINHAEVEQYHTNANDTMSKPRPDTQGKSSLRLRSPERKPRTLDGNGRSTLPNANDLPDPNSVPSSRRSPERHGEHMNKVASTSRKDGDANLFEGFSGLHLSSRILPHTFLKRTLPTERFTIYRVPDLLKQVHSPAYEIPDEVADYVVFGVIASKSSPMDHKPKSSEQYSKASDDWEKKWDDGSQNRKRFIVFTLTDLKWTVDVYLFDRAVPRYHRLSPGTVVAILNPNIMPPKRGREDTGAFSLALNDGEDQILEIGNSKDLGYCKATKKDGGTCDQWVNLSKTEICEWHLSAQIARTRASRMGVNAGTNGFGGGGSRGKDSLDSGRIGYSAKSREGHKYDSDSGSHFYISSSNAHRNGPVHQGSRAPIYNGDRSTARMLDTDDMDPFIAEGQLSRDKEARMQKRMAAQEKERHIARRLGQLGSGGGAEYMRHRTADSQSSATPGSQRSILSNGTGTRKAEVMSSGGGSSSNNSAGESGKKRAAESIRLSPVKKTRFLTDKGIKEAGRESLGTTTAHSTRATQGNEFYDKNGNDDDDDLDIV